jgi:hypothetical protein
LPGPENHIIEEEETMATNAGKQGQSDAQTGKGQKAPTTFTNDTDRKEYQAGYNNAKKK